MLRNVLSGASFVLAVTLGSASTQSADFGPAPQQDVVYETSFLAFDGCWLNKEWLLPPFVFYCQSRFDRVEFGPAKLYVQRGVVYGPVRPGMLCTAGGTCIPGGVRQY